MAVHLELRQQRVDVHVVVIGTAELTEPMRPLLGALREALAREDGPVSWDRAAYTDAAANPNSRPYRSTASVSATNCSSLRASAGSHCSKNSMATRTMSTV